MAVQAEEPRKLYEQLALDVKGGIEDGTLAAGDRLPSVRQMSAARRLSVTTVLEAYRRLEGWGYVEARPQSGYYVRALASEVCETPETRAHEPEALAVDKSHMIAGILSLAMDPDSMPLGAAVMSHEILPVKTLSRMQAQIARRYPEATQAYAFAPGHKGLRKEIARYMSGIGCSLHARDILITCGGTEALGLCLRAVTQPGDLVALESPTYYGFLELIEAHRLQAIEIPTDPCTGMSVDALDDAARRFPIRVVMMMPSFANPFGGLMPDGEKARLAALAARHELPIIEDDIYAACGFEESHPRPISAFDSNGYTMLCSSFSKTTAPGFRIGWTAPGRFYDQVVNLKQCTTRASATLPQYVLADFLASGAYQRHLRRMRTRLNDTMHHFQQTIRAEFPPGTRVTRPTGGHILWVELPHGGDAVALFKSCLEKGISIVPGTLFSPSDRFRSCLRLNAGMVWQPRTEKALRTVGRLAAEQLLHA